MERGGEGEKGSTIQGFDSGMERDGEGWGGMERDGEKWRGMGRDGEEWRGMEGDGGGWRGMESGVERDGEGRKRQR